MRKYIAILFALVILLTCVTPAAAITQVIYSENAKKFIYMAGSDYSPTDLFQNFKDVMPGDTLYQRILLINDTSNKCKVKVYMRALGAHQDSVDFLSQLHLTVSTEEDTIMFDAPLNQRAQLHDWVYLGTLYSGGQVDLWLTLDVPVTLDNNYKDLIGYLDWEFAVEELPIEEGDPDPPRTGDDSRVKLWTGVMAGTFVLLIILVLIPKKKKKK